jgi:hypothetical protein
MTKEETTWDIEAQMRDNNNGSQTVLFCWLFNAALSDYIVPDEWWIGRELEGNGLGLIKVLHQHLSGGNDENHEENQPG